MARGAFDWELLRSRAEEYGTRLPAWLALSALAERGKHLPRGYLESLRPDGRDRLGALFLAALIRRREVSDIGHLLRFLFTEPGKTRARVLVDHMLPKGEFLTQRYGLNGPPTLAQRALRPVRALARAGRLLARLVWTPRHDDRRKRAAASAAKASTS